MKQIAQTEELAALLFHVKQQAGGLPERLTDRAELAVRALARWQKGLGEQLTLPQRAGLSLPMLQEGAGDWIAAQRPERFAALFALEGLQGDSTDRAALGSTWLGDGALPALLEAFVLAVLAGGPHLFRVGRQQAPLFDLLLEAFAVEAACEPFASIRWNRAGDRILRPLLHALDHLTLYGSSETLANIEGELAGMEGQTPRLIAFGHRSSLLWIEAEALEGATEAEVGALGEAVATDLSLWDQRGCMAPHTLWLVDGDEALLARLLDATGGAMHRLAARWPAGAVSRETVEQSFLLGEQAAFAGSLVEGAEFRIMTGVDARARRGPGGRTLRMAAVSRDEAERWLRDEPTSTIGFVGRAAPSAAGARIVAPGQLQATTIDRLHDGQQRLRPMLGR
jgi:hypothetical protein